MQRMQDCSRPQKTMTAGLQSDQVKLCAHRAAAQLGGDCAVAAVVHDCVVQVVAPSCGAVCRSVVRADHAVPQQQSRIISPAADPR